MFARTYATNLEGVYDLSHLKSIHHLPQTRYRFILDGKRTFERWRVHVFSFSGFGKAPVENLLDFVSIKKKVHIPVIECRWLPVTSEWFALLKGTQMEHLCRLSTSSNQEYGYYIFLRKNTPTSPREHSVVILGSIHSWKILGCDLLCPVSSPSAIATRRLWVSILFVSA